VSFNNPDEKPLLIHSQGGSQMKSVLMVLTSHSVLGDSGKGTGWHFGEAAHPWRELTDRGFSVEFASPGGGLTAYYAYNSEDPDQAAFLASFGAVGPITKRTEEIDAAEYGAILLVGGHGTMWDFPTDTNLARVAAEIYESKGFVAAVCHGPAALINLRLSKGALLIEGKRLSAFTDAEEESLGMSTTVPFLLSTTLAQRGAILEAAPNFEAKVTIDGRLITGQNPASARGVGLALCEALQ
jgi:putative intracellular protease/amidase